MFKVILREMDCVLKSFLVRFSKSYNFYFGLLFFLIEFFKLILNKYYISNLLLKTEYIQYNCLLKSDILLPWKRFKGLVL